jgi:hypothetical protein
LNTMRQSTQTGSRYCSPSTSTDSESAPPTASPPGIRPMIGSSPKRKDVPGTVSALSDQKTSRSTKRNTGDKCGQRAWSLLAGAGCAAFNCAQSSLDPVITTWVVPKLRRVKSGSLKQLIRHAAAMCAQPVMHRDHTSRPSLQPELTGGVLRARQHAVAQSAARFFGFARLAAFARLGRAVMRGCEARSRQA